VNAPEFIPKFSAPLGDWSAHQQHHQEAPSQVYPPPQVFAPNSRPFPPQQQQQIPFAAQPRPAHYVYQQNRNFGQNSRPDLAQNQHHNNHHPNYSNHQQQQQQMYMMNQQQGGGGGGGGHQMGNNYHGGGGGHQNRGGIHNRLNFNAANSEPAQVEPMPHKQVKKKKKII
jgi:hypothetical protein